MTTEQATKVRDYMESRGMEFTFINDGEMITRTDIREGYGLSFMGDKE